MASHRDPRFLHNLSYHPRWHHDSIQVKRKGRVRTVAANSCSGYSAFKSRAASSSKPQLPSSSVRRSRSWSGHRLLLQLLVISSLPCQAWATTFKVALVGPWTCDPLYSKSLPDLAARLATSRINKDPSLNKGYWSMRTACQPVPWPALQSWKVMVLQFWAPPTQDTAPQPLCMQKSGMLGFFPGLASNPTWIN